MLYYNTVNDLLKNSLITLMNAPIFQNFISFEQADDDFDPICYKGKYWEFIKEDFEEIIKDNFR